MLDTTKKNSENASILFGIMLFFIILGILITTFGIIKIIIFNSKIKKYDENEYGFMELEMDELETLKYEKYNLYLTNHYVIWLPNAFMGYKYEDILWMYPEVRNNITVGLRILTKDGITSRLIYIKGNVDNNDNINIQNIWNKIYEKNRNIALGYTEENVSKFMTYVK